MKINIKEELIIHLVNGETRLIPLDRLGFMKRYACQHCDDYSSEFADISFGGIAAQEGWTTVITRTPLGRAAFAHARDEGDLEIYPRVKNPRFASEASSKILEWSEKKRKQSLKNREKLIKQAVDVKE